MTAGAAGGALSHLRVLDLSRVLAGPWCGQILADLGADVIKVERPGSGDDTRGWGPPYHVAPDGRETAESAYFMAANRGKRSVCIDIASADGQSLVRDLAARCDIVLENYKAGGLARYGLDYAALSAANPRLIWCAITGFGQDGPYAARPGYDFMIQGLGGLMSITGERDDLPGGGPQKVGVAVADLMSGMYATVGVLAALAARERTGLGQYIDLALFDVQVAMLANQAMNYLVSGRPPVRHGNAHPNIVPYQVFATADGHVIVAVGNDAQFRRFCEVAGCAALADDPRYARNRDRVARRDELIARIAPLLAARGSAEWLEALENASVPCGPINDLDRVFRDPQLLHRQMVWRAPHAAGGEVAMVASPLRMSRTPAANPGAPPVLGQHTDEVLGNVLGLERERIQALRADGVIA